LSSLSDCIKKEHILVSFKTMKFCTNENAYFDCINGELLAKK